MSCEASVWFCEGAGAAMPRSSHEPASAAYYWFVHKHQTVDVMTHVSAKQTCAS